MNSRHIQNIELRYAKTSVGPNAVSPVTVNTSSTEIIPADTTNRRMKVTLQNNGTEPCIIKLGGAVSTSDYHYVLSDGTAARDGLGASIVLENFTGAIYGITEANSTAISVLEIKHK